MEEEKPEISHIDVHKEEASQLYTYRPGSSEEKALVRKIDRRLLPTLWIMYVVSSYRGSDFNSSLTFEGFPVQLSGPVRAFHSLPPPAAWGPAGTPSAKDRLLTLVCGCAERTLE